MHTSEIRIACVTRFGSRDLCAQLGETALHYACWQRAHRIVALLVSAGAQCNATVTVRDTSITACPRAAKSPLPVTIIRPIIPVTIILEKFAKNAVVPA